MKVMEVMEVIKKTEKSESAIRELMSGIVDQLFNKEYHKKPDFISCDLSKKSLEFAKNLANNHFHGL
ncbi:MAG: hypothetical protein WCL18_07610 [bacterium]